MGFSLPEKEKKQGLNENEIAPEQEENAFGLTVDESRQAHLDFLTSLILIGVCIALIVTCQKYYHQQLARRIVSTFYESTGFMPTIFALFLLVMAVSLLVKSLKYGGVGKHCRQLAASFKATMKSRTFWKAVGGLAIFAVYVYALLGKLSFGVASFIVLLATLLYTHIDGKVKTAVKMVIIALCAVVGIVLLFQYAFSVPMP